MGPVLLVTVLLAATAFGLWRRHTDGRVRALAVDTVDESRLSAAEIGGDLGERATLVQFSTAFCQPCRATRRILADVAGIVPGVRHVEVDAESSLELVRRLDVTRTPTTLVLDAAGRPVYRAVGAPRREQVLAALARAVD